jgi:hypothetical protein
MDCWNSSSAALLNTFEDRRQYASYTSSVFASERLWENSILNCFSPEGGVATRPYICGIEAPSFNLRSTRTSPLRGRYSQSEKVNFR